MTLKRLLSGMLSPACAAISAAVMPSGTSGAVISSVFSSAKAIPGINRLSSMASIMAAARIAFQCFIRSFMIKSPLQQEFQLGYILLQYIISQRAPDSNEKCGNKK